jgi:hypothetical protein
MHESCTVFRRFEFEGASLPSFVARFAHWDAGQDRAASDAGNATHLSLDVHHFEFPRESVDEILRREAEIQSSIGATLAPTDEGANRCATMVYCWHFPGRLVTQSLQWLSDPRTALLEQLWAATAPNPKGLTPLRFIERFDVESFCDYVDATLDQLPTIHQLLDGH